MSTIQSRTPEKEAKKPRDIDLKISMKILFHCSPTFPFSFPILSPNPKILKAFLNTLPTKMKPTKCPAREKKMRHDDWAKSRNNREPTDIAFLDFSKAFHSVPHKRLLFKLERHGIDSSALQWFHNFLTGWMQRIVLRGTCSSWSPVLSGVPQ